MIRLNKESYHKVIQPLNSVTINNLFALAVAQNKVKGEVFVDNVDKPRTFYVVHPYGMSLLFGDFSNEQFNIDFKKYALNTEGNRTKPEWMQVFPNDWDTVLANLFDDKLTKSVTNNNSTGMVELDTRVNFQFDKDAYQDYKQANSDTDTHIRIVPTDKQVFEEMKGVVVPLRFWDNADDFVTNGAGFSLYYDNQLASTAFSAFADNDKLELGIETCEKFKGKGLAHKVSSALIDYCLEKELEPIWACRLGNTGSLMLAQKLGFRKSKEISYYRLT